MSDGDETVGEFLERVKEASGVLHDYGYRAEITGEFEVCEHKRTYRTEYGEKCHDCPVYIWRIPSE